MLDQTQEQMAAYVAGHKQRMAAERRARRQRHEEAMTQAVAMAAALQARYPGVRVWLFGSALDAARFDLTSDLDLACEGLPPAQYWVAYGLLEECGRIPFDLVLLELATERLAARVRNEGRRLI